jgi:hypothetical protein
VLVEIFDVEEQPVPDAVENDLPGADEIAGPSLPSWPCRFDPGHPLHCFRRSAHLQFPRAVALLTTGYRVGQILGLLIVTATAAQWLPRRVAGRCRDRAGCRPGRSRFAGVLPAQCRRDGRTVPARNEAPTPVGGNSVFLTPETEAS